MGRWSGPDIEARIAGEFELVVLLAETDRAISCDSSDNDGH